MARIGFSSIVKDIENLIDDELEDYKELIRDHMAAAYEDVVSASPVLTAYYKSNHSLAVRSGGSLKTEGVTLEPAVKESEERGVYEANVNPRMSKELAKLQEYEIGDTIRIATDVPYAEDVEAKHGVYSGVAEGFNLRFR